MDKFSEITIFTTLQLDKNSITYIENIIECNIKKTPHNNKIVRGNCAC